MNGRIIKERHMRKWGGYYIKTLEFDNSEYGGEGTTEIKMAFNEDDVYIGDPSFAYHLYMRKGIKPEPINEIKDICSVGFCEEEQKWYGWSHRAIFGFGIGSTVEFGDIAYQPKSMRDFIDDRLNFWKDDNRKNVHAKLDIRDGVDGFEIKWESPGRNMIDGIWEPFPDHYGRGEWTAQTLDDARQMACDFARGVA